MNVSLNSISGIDDAIVAMFMSKRSWTPALDNGIRTICAKCFTKPYGIYDSYDLEKDERDRFESWMETLVKWGWQHTTLLRFIDMSFTVEGLHRAGQDDWDSHAKRFDNRIIRSSTRLADFSEGEKSKYYEGKILSTDEALKILEVNIPDKIEVDGEAYVKGVNGYIKEGLENNKDVKRGLYMLSIPSNFIFKVNLCEFAHVYKERNEKGSAHPEVKELAEDCVRLIEGAIPWFTREFIEKVKN